MIRRAAAALLLTALLLTACGSDEPGADSTPGATARPAAGSDDEAAPDATDAPDAPVATAPDSIDTMSVETDGPDVIDDSIVDTSPSAPPGDLTAEVCAELQIATEYQQALDEMDQDTATWEEIETFTAERTPRVLEAYARVASLVPALAEASAQAAEFVEFLSGIVAAADSFEEGEALFERVSGEEQDRLFELTLGLEALDEHARQCT